MPLGYPLSYQCYHKSPRNTAGVTAKPEQIMCSYNAVNGIPTCLDDKAQNGYLREELGFDGLIFSDCDAVGDAFSKHHYSVSASDAAASGIRAGCTVRVFRLKFTLEDVIGSHACSLEANMRVTNGIPLGWPLFLPVHTVNCVQTLKVTWIVEPRTVLGFEPD
jgi:hypothetical protein